MVYAPRKLVFLFFVVIFTIAFIGMLYLVFLNQPLKVEDGASVSLVGQNVVLKMRVTNTSNQILRGTVVTIKSANGEVTYPLKEDKSGDDSIAPGASFDYIKSWPIADVIAYDVYVSAPFSRAVHLPISLKEETLKPIEAKIYQLPSNMKINQTYTYSVRICNISGSDIAEVFWYESAEDGFFSEDLLDRQRVLKLDSIECKTIYSTLTPIQLGKLIVNFHWKVGELDRSFPQELNVTQ